MSPTATAIAALLDERLRVSDFPDYPPALNGLQLDHRGPVRKVAGAVDFSRRSIHAAIAAGANMILLHHGMFWAGPQRLVGAAHERIRDLITHDVAVYAAHLPLDAHPELGNCARLAGELDLAVSGRFGEYQGVPIGVSGVASVTLGELCDRLGRVVNRYGGTVRRSHGVEDRPCNRWAIITGAGADSATLRGAREQGIDTLIVGEGPHHVTVDAEEAGVVVLYGGHYATETLGVEALLDLVADTFALPTEFLLLPTGS